MELTGIAIFYFICMAAGLLFAVLIAVLGEVFGHGDVGMGHDVGLDTSGVDVGHDVDVSHDMSPGGHVIGVDTDHGSTMPGASFFNSLTISVLVGFFGLSGLFALWVLGMSPISSLVFAVPVGFISALGEFLLYVKVFIRAQGSSEATMSEILGCQADVITGIPGDRVGEIAYVIKGSRYTAPAVSQDGTDLPRGTRVQVVNIKGTSFVVRPI